MKTYWGSGGIVPCILNLGARWRQVVSFMHSLIYFWEKSLQYLLDRGLGAPQSWSGHIGEEKNIPTSNQIPVVQPVA
jgi:hypothetical protein